MEEFGHRKQEGEVVWMYRGRETKKKKWLNEVKNTDELGIEKRRSDKREEMKTDARIKTTY